MTVPPNGTDAKDIAVHFAKTINFKVTKKFMVVTIQQAKGFLNHGYTKEEIIYAIDKMVEKKSNIYSLSYIGFTLDDWAMQLRNEKAKAEIDELIKKEEMRRRNEVIADDESTIRNQGKLNRFGANMSKWGDMFND